MQRNIIIAVFLFIINPQIGNGQVNLQKGSLDFTIPIYSFKDNLSRLSFDLGINYSSGNGLVVNQIAGALGTGWDLKGVPSIKRIIRGLPDDQIPKQGTWNDTSKYPPGYLYNNVPISNGCPTALNTYPIFQEPHNYYKSDNKTNADREVDIFIVELGERRFRFILDKTNPQKAISIDENKALISFTTDGGTDNYRTSITQFTIVDEGGIIYEFANRAKTQVFNIGGSPAYYEYCNSRTTPLCSFEQCHELPLTSKPFICNEWNVTRITDPRNGRDIKFEYFSQFYYFENRELVSAELSPQSQPAGGPNISAPIISNMQDPHGVQSTVSIYDLKGVDLRNKIEKNEIKRIIFPNQFTLDLDYSISRWDLYGPVALRSIDLNNQHENLFTYKFYYNYFVKNEVKTSISSSSEDQRWARLCLAGIQKIGTNPVNRETDSERPWEFEYYLGSNNVEDFVPPPFFHARDNWGYYNGSYSGTPTDRFLDKNGELNIWAKVCLYNQPKRNSPNSELISTAKQGYAKNGLLRKVINNFGGTTLYEYEQNFYSQADDPMEHDPENLYVAYDCMVNIGCAAGGVHISKIIKKQFSGNVDKITDYSFTNPNGSSSLWGIEPQKFLVERTVRFEPENQYGTISGCKYHFRYSGYSQHEYRPSFFVIASNIVVNFIKDQVISYFVGVGDPIVQVLMGVINYILSCTGSPTQFFTHDIKYHHQLNSNLLSSQFRRVLVKEYSTDWTTSGSTEYQFTSPEDFALLIPTNPFPYTQKLREYSWMYGLPKKIRILDNAGREKKIIENTYQNIRTDLEAPQTRSCNCESYYSESLKIDFWNDPTNYDSYLDVGSNQLKVDFYNISFGRPELINNVEKIVDDNGNKFTSETNYRYNEKNNNIASQTTTNSKGTLIETNFYYPTDYDLDLPEHDVLKEMVNQNRINTLIATETWQTPKNQQKEMLSCSVNQYGFDDRGDTKLIQLIQLETDRPVSYGQIGDFDPQRLIRHPLLKSQQQFSYEKGSPIQIDNLVGSSVSSIIYGYGGMIPIASVINATNREVAYTSFERYNDEIVKHKWRLDESCIITYPNSAEYNTTGYSCLFLNSNNCEITLDPGIQMDKDFVLSFWATSPVQINTISTLFNTGPEINGWRYYEYLIPSGAAQPRITSNNSKIDELRFYPKNAQMSTTTYLPGFGKTSECDVNNRILYYEYDGLSRLSKVKDEKRNIIKTYEYHFKTN